RRRWCASTDGGRRSDRHDDLAAGPAALELGERRAHLGEWIAAMQHRAQPAGVDPAGELGELGAVGPHEQVDEARAGAGSGAAATTPSGAATRSASPPMRSFSGRANTASPARNRVTLAPARATTPATSQPSAIGGSSRSTSLTLPSRILKSSGLRLAAL